MSVLNLLKQKGSEVFSIDPSKKLIDCVRMLNEKRIGALLVMTKAGNLEGIVSERDIMRKAIDTTAKITETPVSEAMTPRNKLITATKDDSVQEIMSLMTKHRIRHLPIMDCQKVVGILSIGDVVKAVLGEVQAENKQLQDYISGKY